MADIRLESFRGAVKDGARPNRFLLTINSPSGNSDVITYLVKSAVLPGRTIGDVEMNWQGMKVKVAGDPTFNDFSVTFINDYAFEAKNMIEAWLELIAKMDTNERTDQTEYKKDLKMQQLGRKGEVIKTYWLIGAYPGDMADVDMSMESNDTISDFSVTFKYDYFRAE